MPRKPAKPSMEGDGLLLHLLQFLAAGAYYFLSAQTIINRGYVHPDVRQMVGLMCLSDSSFCMLSGAWSRRRASLLFFLSGGDDCQNEALGESGEREGVVRQKNAST